MSNPKHNASGCTDPTAYEAVKNTVSDEKIDKLADKAKQSLTAFALGYGFASTGCKLVHFETGKRYSL